jgi:peptidoglycan hydrolase-like protein with peptidoglycan-binding domain
MTLNRVAIPSPNYSSRGAAVRLIVLHTAEGSTSYQSLGSYFASSSSQVSSHAGIDDTPNTIGVYVKRADKAWTAANANPVAVQAELCAFAAWDSATWQSHQEMLNNTAKWIAEEAAAFGIPIVKLTASEAQSGAAGVCQHADLGSWGGGHWDCGSSFPIDDVLAMAGGSSPIPAPPPKPPSPGAAPPWPYGSLDYLGQPSSDPYCHSGYYGGEDNTNVRMWQAQMRARGWDIDADGMYGPSSENVCRQFQQEKGLDVDGLVGPETWDASWLAPVT